MQKAADPGCGFRGLEAADALSQVNRSVVSRQRSPGRRPWRARRCRRGSWRTRGRPSRPGWRWTRGVSTWAHAGMPRTRPSVGRATDGCAIQIVFMLIGPPPSVSRARSVPGSVRVRVLAGVRYSPPRAGRKPFFADFLRRVRRPSPRRAAPARRRRSVRAWPGRCRRWPAAGSRWPGALGDQLQGGVGEHHEGRHLLLTGPLAAPLPEPLEQRLVVGRGAVVAPAALLLRAGGSALPHSRQVTALRDRDAGTPRLRVGARRASGRGSGRACAAAAARVAGQRPRQRQVTAGPGHPDVEQPPLLLDRARGCRRRRSAGCPPADRRRTRRPTRGPWRRAGSPA